MTTEELLYPRYQVSMEGYPNMQFKRGEILTLSDATEQGMPCIHYDNTGFGKGFFDKFPSIFRRLRWYENRDKEEYPMYVRGVKEYFTIPIGRVLKVRSTFPHDPSLMYAIDINMSIILSHFAPATEEEYLNYINSTKL